MKLSLLFFSGVALAALSFACSAPTEDAQPGAPTGAEESEVQSTDLAGNYEPNTDDDGYDFASAKVTRSGTKLTLTLDGIKSISRRRVRARTSSRRAT